MYCKHKNVYYSFLIQYNDKIKCISHIFIEILFKLIFLYKLYWVFPLKKPSEILFSFNKIHLNYWNIFEHTLNALFVSQYKGTWKYLQFSLVVGNKIKWFLFPKITFLVNVTQNDYWKFIDSIVLSSFCAWITHLWRLTIVLEIL